MNDSGWVQDPRGKRPPLWARVVGFVIVLTVTVAIVVATVATGSFVGYVVDTTLTTTLGPLESKLTGWTALLTLIMCLWSQRHHRREI